MIFIAIYSAGYLLTYYHADEVTRTSLDGNDNVEVSQIGPDYFFDEPAKDKAIVFIPGGKVEETAYAHLLLKISEQGVDCFLVKVPFRLAVLGINAPDRIIENYDYDSWYLAGHSLGGSVASFYAEAHDEKVDGLILLAAYTTKEIPDTIDLLSIYGDLDGCLSMENYKEYRVNWPFNGSEIIIEGGNHSNFGNYGKQQDG